MATLETLLQGFKDTYTKEWYAAQYIKFKNHYANPDNEESFSVLLEQYGGYIPQEESKVITFWDFIYDVSISSIYEDVENEDKFVIVGEDGEGRPMEALATGENYINYACDLQLKVWERKFETYFSDKLKKISSLIESGRFLQFLINRIEYEIVLLKEQKDSLKVLITFFEIILLELRKQATELQEISDMIGTSQPIIWEDDIIDLARLLLDMEKHLLLKGDTVLAEQFFPFFTFQKKAFTTESLRRAIQEDRKKRQLFK